MDSIRSALAQVALGREDGELSLAIDFGTAYSSVSWIKGTTLHINDIHDISDWPCASYGGPATSRVGEVPSEWQYRKGVRKFGYEVHKMLSKPGHEEWYRLANIKMFLDNSEGSLKIRRQNLRIIRTINETRADHEKPISVFDIIYDYLFFLLSHAKKELSKKNVRGNSCYTPGDPIKYVLSIPEKWDAVAKWTMEKALALVTEKLQFGSIRDLFMISESESASTYMLESVNHVWSPKSESVITADAGGGTTDVATFRVTNERPLRFKRVGKSEARSIGSSFLDQLFREHIEDRVKEETHLNDIPNGSTIPELIDIAVLEFHRQMKRRFGDDLEGGPEYVPFNGLGHDGKKGFERGVVLVTQCDLAKIFDPICDEVWEMIEGQISTARQEGYSPSKVFLVGGLGLSMYLQNRIQMRLASEYENIELFDTREFMNDKFTAVVSRGALFRSLNKELGPKRLNNSGFGIAQNELLRADFEGHQDGETYIDEVDGETYVTDCLYYPYKPRQEMPPEGMSVSHIMWEILRSGQDFDVRVPVYMSGGDCLDHYHINHPRNAGAHKLGELVFKTTFDDIKKHSTASSFKRKKGYFLIKYEVVIRMAGLRMEYEMRYPPNGKLRAGGTLENIAAAFDLGVA